MVHSAHAGVKGQRAGARSVLPSSASQAARETWQHVPLPTELSHWPFEFVSSKAGVSVEH